MTIIDVGSNIGEYAGFMLSLKNNLTIHCFEPSKSTFEQLKKNLTKAIDAKKVKPNNFGLGITEAETELFVYSETGGSNSIYYNEHYASVTGSCTKENIIIKTLDDYVKLNDISKIDFLKIDVEGHEFAVMLGSKRILAEGIIKSIQFEYNDYWKVSGYRLADVFSFLKEFNYEIFRLTPWGKIKIRRFKPGLENYKHSNYYAVKND